MNNVRIPYQRCRDWHRRLLLTLAGLIGLLASPMALAEMAYSDTEFDFKNQWSLFGPYIIPDDAPSGEFSAQQVLVNGNPDAHLEVTMTRPTVDPGKSAAVWGAVINDTFVWDPAAQSNGPLGRLDFLLDVRDGGAWSLAVKQGEHVWMALSRRKFGVLNGWATLSIDCLEEVDFVPVPGSEFIVQDQPRHPDFSSTGAPISFGIGAGLSCPTTSDCTRIIPAVFGLDNLQVTARPPLKINAGLNDAWFEPATAGQGILHIVFPEIESIFVAWFTYDTERPPEDVMAILGEPGHRWLTAQGGYEGDTELLDIYLTQGGVFDSNNPPPDLPEVVGTMTIEWCSCERGRLAYNMPAQNLSGIIELERITPDNVALCEALQEP
jgi:hypothetical protein